MKAEKKGIEFPLGISHETHKWWKTATADEVENMVNAGADVNARDENGKTPLFYAALYNPHPEVIALMVRHGADVNARNEAGDTPLHWAAEYNPKPDVTEALVAAGADVNARGYDRKTPLHGALYGTRFYNPGPEVIKLLVGLGAGLNVRDEAGLTPLELAEAKGAGPAIIEALMPASSDQGTGISADSLLRQGVASLRERQGVSESVEPVAPGLH